ncbi:exodeoxyribonuclease VII small subunit [Salinicola sp. LHM]|uniref:exodeoxyribonuclease VII small subunit n=1 Tax=unclassified Salinicola TaxID=2634022 RepID=UPI002ACDFA62|nr:exodeoxyribonuclease VII small subunit [Salinicola sp. LHM]WQH35076.1 exodeoxyribonuclease VII small subunit [Salinicola sp. LHM]
MADKDVSQDVDASQNADVAKDFAATLDQLETLVAQLESGELTLEASLTAFERGIRLTRDAQHRLDSAELKVQALLEQSDGSLQAVPFDDPEPFDQEPNHER